MTCTHTVTRLLEPIIKDYCVNVPEICVSCGEPVAVVSYGKDAWIHRQMKRIADVQQAQLPLIE